MKKKGILICALSLIIAVSSFIALSNVTTVKAEEKTYFALLNENAYLNAIPNTGVVGTKKLAPASGSYSEYSVYGKATSSTSFSYFATTFDPTNKNKAAANEVVDLSDTTKAIKFQLYIYDSTINKGADVSGKGAFTAALTYEVDDNAKWTAQYQGYRLWKNTFNTWSGNTLYNGCWNEITMGVNWLVNNNTAPGDWSGSLANACGFGLLIPSLGGTTEILVNGIEIVTANDFCLVSHTQQDISFDTQPQEQETFEEFNFVDFADGMYTNAIGTKGVKGLSTAVPTSNANGTNSIFGYASTSNIFSFIATTYDSAKDGVESTTGKKLTYSKAAITFNIYVYDKSKDLGASLEGNAITFGLTNYLDSYSINGSALDDKRYFKNTFNTWSGNKIENGKWAKITCKLSWLSGGLWNNDKTLGNITAAAIQVPSMGGDTIVLVNGIRCIQYGDGAADCTVNALNQVDLIPNVSIENVTSTDETTADLSITTTETTYSGKITVADKEISFTQEDMSEKLGAVAITTAGTHQITLDFKAANGITITKTASATVTGKPVFTVSGGKYYTLGSKAEVNLAMEDFGGVTELSCSITNGNQEDDAVVTEFPAKYEFDVNLASEYTVTATFTYKYNGEPQQVVKDIKVVGYTKENVTSNVTANQWNSYVSNGQTAELTNNAQGFRFYDGVRFMYAKDSGSSLKVGFRTQDDVFNKGEGGVDLSTYGEDVALVFYVWAENNLTLLGDSLLASRSDCWYSAAANSKIGTPSFEGGKLSTYIIKLKDLSGDFSSQYFCLIYLQANYSGAVLVSDGYVILTEKSTGVYDAKDFTPDFVGPTFDLATTSAEINTNTSLVVTTEETTYTGSLTIGSTVITFSNEDIQDKLGEYVFTKSGNYTLNYVLTDSCGNSTTKNISFSVTGAPAFEVSTDNVVYLNTDLAISLTGTEVEYSTNLSIKLYIEDEEIETYTTCPVNYTFKKAVAGEYEVKFVISYTYKGENSSDTKTLNVIVIDGNAKTNITENFTIANYTSYQSSNATGDQTCWLCKNLQGYRVYDGVKYVYTTANGSTQFGVALELDVLNKGDGGIDFTQYNESGYAAIMFYIYSDVAGEVKGKYAARSDVWVDYADSTDLPVFSVEAGKLQKVVIRISDLNSEYAKCLALIKFNIAQTANMLVSDIYVINTMSNTGVYEATSFNPSFVAPAMTAKATVTGEYDEFVGIEPIVDSEENYSITAKIYVDEALVGTIEATKAQVATALGQYKFITGGTYVVKYTLVNDNLNTSTLEVTYTITGEPEVIQITANLDDFATEYYEGEVDLSYIKVVNYYGNDIDFTVKVYDSNSQEITFTGNTVSLLKGNYVVKITAEYKGTPFTQDVNISVISMNDDDPTGGDDKGGDNNDNPQSKKSGCGSNMGLPLSLLGLSIVAVIRKRK